MFLNFVIGTIPAPILFGTLIDKTCQSWQETCQRSRGACFIYDNWMMATYLLALIFCFKGLSFCFFMLALLLYKSPKSVARPSETTNLNSVNLVLGKGTVPPPKACQTEPLPPQNTKNQVLSNNCHDHNETVVLVGR